MLRYAEGLPASPPVLYKFVVERRGAPLFFCSADLLSVEAEVGKGQAESVDEAVRENRHPEIAARQHVG